MHQLFALRIIYLISLFTFNICLYLDFPGIGQLPQLPGTHFIIHIFFYLFFFFVDIDKQFNLAFVHNRVPKHCNIKN